MAIDGSERSIYDYVERQLREPVTGDVELMITFYWRDQCNLAFEPALLDALARHRAWLSVSCIEDPVDDKNQMQTTNKATQ